MSNKDEYPKRDRKENVQIEVVKAGIRIRGNKTQVVLTDSENLEYTSKLQKSIKKVEEDKSLSMEIVEEEKHQVKKEELNKHLPDVFKAIADYLKENKKILLNVSYSSVINLDDLEQEVKYNFFYDSDVETIYSPKIHKTDERLQKLIEKADKRKKGEQVDI